MTIYESYKQKYKDNEKAIKYIINPKHQDILIHFLGEAESKILCLVFKLFKEKLDDHKKGVFKSNIIFTSNFVKEETDLSSYRQSKAIEELTMKFGIIDWAYIRYSGLPHSVRAIKINFDKIEGFCNKFASFYHEFVRLEKLSKEELVKMLISERENNRLLLELLASDVEDEDYEYEDDDYEDEEVLAN